MKIVFFNEYEGIGGGENLIVNIVQQLHLSNQIVTKIICPETGYLYRRLHELKIPFEHITSQKEDFSADVMPDDVLIRTDFGNMKKFKKCNAKLIYWEILPTVFASTLYKKKSIYKQLLINYMVRNNALFFMDKNGVEEIKRRNYTLKKTNYLPIPVKIENNIPVLKKAPVGKRITITYVGRDVEWKIFPLKKVIEDCAALHEYAFDFVVFCDSSKNYKQILGKKYANIQIRYTEGVYGNDLDEMLGKQADVHFAMGTSALDGAKMGIPTVLLDFSEKEFPSTYLYKFICHTKGFSLGDDVVNFEPGKFDLTMEKIIETIMNERSYKKVQRDCYSYVKENHSLQSITANLISACNDTDAVTKSVYQKLKGVYYESRYKQLIGID
jgi:hypothetical protein